MGSQPRSQGLSLPWEKTLGTRLVGSKPHKLCRVISWNLVLGSIVLGCILIYRNWSIKICRRHTTYQAWLHHSPDAIYPHDHVTTRTPHASIFDAGLAAHETRLLRHVGSTAVFMKTPCSGKIDVITIYFFIQ